MKAFLTRISRLYPLVVLAHDFPENVLRWAAPKYKMSRTTQQIFPLIQHWGVGRGMSFRKDTVSGDIFLHFAFFTSFKSIFWHRIHVRDTLGTRDFFLACDVELRRPQADTSSAFGQRHERRSR